MAYAGEYPNPEGDCPAELDEGYDLSDLFALLLTRGVDGLWKRGLFKSYVANSDTIAGIKGRLDVSATIGKQLHLAGKTYCETDELSVDILPNQILKAGIRCLLSFPSLSRSRRDELKITERLLHGISDIPLHPAFFRGLVVHRNMYRYRFLLFVCQMLANLTSISEDGKSVQFFDLLKDERQLAIIFEKFVRNLLISENPHLKEGVRQLKWSFLPETAGAENLLGGMNTDISLESADKIWIIDTKYYASALIDGRFGERKVKQSNLYQMYAYMNHYPGFSGKAMDGVLLYPKSSEEVNNVLVDKSRNRKLHIKTVDLSASWREIKEELCSIVAS